MSTINTFVCNKCDNSVSGYSKMKPLRKRPFLHKLLKIKRKIEYEYDEDFHNTPCPLCNGGMFIIDQKATLFLHDKEDPEVMLKSKNLPLFKTKKIDYKCTNCWYKIHGHRSLYRDMKGVLSGLFFRGFLAKYTEPLFAINQNFQDLECPMCKAGTFIEYIKNFEEVK